MLDANCIANQPEAVTILCRNLKGELLLKEKKYQSALVTFSNIIRSNETNIRAYCGVANCFESMGKLNNELEIWNIICNLLHIQVGQKTKCDMVGINWIIDNLFPYDLIKKNLAILTFARKCFAAGEYHDAAEKYLDLLALIDDDADNADGMNLSEIKQEAALSLLVIGNVDVCLALCQDLTNSKKSVKRKFDESQQNDLIFNYLFARCFSLSGDPETSLSYLDRALRSCVGNNDIHYQGKCIKMGENSSEVVSESSYNGLSLRIMLKLRARLYIEKAIVYKSANDLKACKMAVKSAVRLFPDPNYANYIQQYMEVEDFKIEEENSRLSDVNEEKVTNFCLKFLLDSSSLFITLDEVNIDDNNE